MGAVGSEGRRWQDDGHRSVRAQSPPSPKAHETQPDEGLIQTGDGNKLGRCEQSYGGRKETRREGGTAGSYFVPLLKNESNSPSSPLAPSSFPSKLSDPPSSDGFTGGGREERTAPISHSRTNLHLSSKKKREKRLVSFLFSNWRGEFFLTPFSFFQKRAAASGSEIK